jgi:hypothetical protein
MEVGNSEYVAHVKHAAERPPRKSGLGWIREHSFECDFGYRPFTLIWGHLCVPKTLNANVVVMKPAQDRV